MALLAHVLDRLLLEGYRVQGTPRSQAKAKFFEKKYANRSSDISFVIVPDIQAPNALDAAMTDVDYVCHVASPYLIPHSNVTSIPTDFSSSPPPTTHSRSSSIRQSMELISSALKANKLKRLTIMSSLSKNPRAGYTYAEND
jgi:hypothetical protein